jgi:hypothetical protein
MAKQPIDKHRARLAELIEALSDRLDRTRDHAMVPGNAWLAQGELRNLMLVANEIETLLDEIKEADVENGY